MGSIAGLFGTPGRRRLNNPEWTRGVYRHGPFTAPSPDGARSWSARFAYHNRMSEKTSNGLGRPRSRQSIRRPAGSQNGIQ